MSNRNAEESMACLLCSNLSSLQADNMPLPDTSRTKNNNFSAFPRKLNFIPQFLIIFIALPEYSLQVHSLYKRVVSKVEKSWDPTNADQRDCLILCTDCSLVYISHVVIWCFFFGHCHYHTAGSLLLRVSQALIYRATIWRASHAAFMLSVIPA